METCIRQREQEIREELETKIKNNKVKYNQELQRAHEMLSEREQELD